MNATMRGRFQSGSSVKAGIANAPIQRCCSIWCLAHRRVAQRSLPALSVTDARLVAFPVRSLKGVFAWISCPAVLDRLKCDAALAGFQLPWPDWTLKDTEGAISSAGCDCLVGDSLVLEESEFKKVKSDIKPAADWIATHLLPEAASNQAYAGTITRFPRHFVVLSDDYFTHFVRHATEIMARVGLNYETKTVKQGALFYQEFLPTESLFCSVVLANAAQCAPVQKTLPAILATLTDYLPAVLQVGGDETTGKGYCAARFAQSANGGKRGGQS